MSQRFLDALRSGRVLLMDGAMGTELQRAGLRPGECGEAWNLTHPERVRAIHQAYVDAGAEVLLTNTFQATPSAKVSRQATGGLPELMRRAAALARTAEPSPHFLLADVGPFEAPRERLVQHFRDCKELLSALRDVDAVLAETWTDRASFGALLRADWSFDPAPRWPILVSVTYRRDEKGRLVTFQGHSPRQWVRRADSAGVAALGVNCGRDIGMDEIIEIVRRYRDHTDLPLFARPNAGTPTRSGDQWVYPQTPERMAERLPELLEAGVSMVGGCCGTTPAHIAAFRPVVDAWNAS